MLDLAIATTTPESPVAFRERMLAFWRREASYWRSIQDDAMAGRCEDYAESWTYGGERGLAELLEAPSCSDG